jgi:polysaccharide export outer membrane protein
MKKILFYIFILSLFVTGASDASDRETFYRISPGDELEISVWKDESLSRQLIVPPDGFISFPLIGDIDTKNLTVTELRKIVTKRLSEYIPDATVTVIVTRVKEPKGYVIGKVNKPGEFIISSKTNVMQILAMAGGMNPFASEGNILILRQDKNSIVKIPFNYKQVEKGKNLEQNIIIKNGDVVVVP